MRTGTTRRRRGGGRIGLARKKGRLAYDRATFVAFPDIAPDLVEKPADPHKGAARECPILLQQLQTGAVRRGVEWGENGSVGTAAGVRGIRGWMAE